MQAGQGAAHLVGLLWQRPAAGCCPRASEALQELIRCWVCAGGGGGLVTLALSCAPLIEKQQVSRSRQGSVAHQAGTV
jgi:hypothetical protein